MAKIPTKHFIFSQTAFYHGFFSPKKFQHVLKIDKVINTNRINFIRS